MAQKTSIQWTDRSSNPIYATNTETNKRGWFCTKPSTGCAHCYSERLNLRFGNKLTYSTKNLNKVRFELDERELDRLRKAKRPQRIFICDMTDLFHEAISDEMIEKVFDAMFESVHTFQILTKRPARMRAFIKRMLEPGLTDKMLENIWLGTSIENQETADERVPELLKTRGMIRWLSIEPLLGPINLHAIKDPKNAELTFDALSRKGGIAFKSGIGIDWCVLGGESGTSARPCNLDWIRSIAHQSEEANVPYFIKQLGTKAECGLPNAPLMMHSLGLRDSKGGEPSEWPEDLRIREFPHTPAT